MCFLGLRTAWNQRNQKRTESFGPKKAVAAQICVTMYQARKALQPLRRGTPPNTTSGGCGGKGTKQTPAKGRAGKIERNKYGNYSPKAEPRQFKELPHCQTRGASPPLSWQSLLIDLDQPHVVSIFPFYEWKKFFVHNPGPAVYCMWELGGGMIIIFSAPYCRATGAISRSGGKKCTSSARVLQLEPKDVTGWGIGWPPLKRVS